MSHSYSSMFAHIVWTTKKRIPFFHSPQKEQLHTYIRTIIENQNTELLAIGGMPDQVHILVRLRSEQDIASFMRKVKATSSRLVKTMGEDYSCFSWQIGSGRFSTSASHVNRVRSYILNQEEHHKHWTFEEEMEFFSKL